MHLIIGNRIAEALNIEDRTSFLLGCVAPDAVQTKNESHFFKGEHQNYTRHVDYNGFLEKYRSYSDNLYVLGYYVHLIADDQWMKGFYLPWLRNRMEEDAGVYPLYHNDFRLLNAKLLEDYGCTDELSKAMHGIPNVIDLEEVKSRDVVEFIPYVFGDMTYEKHIIDEPLNVFSYIQIKGYIETSVNYILRTMKEGDLWIN